MKTSFERVEWSASTNIYEVNLRQYTVQGDLKAFMEHLPRLANMGVETIWFMPLTPISNENRKGTLGSYYACSSYTRMNPEFGTFHDFKAVVEAAHDLGMKVIIDWVANHTGCGHEWTLNHPEFYKKDSNGNFYDAHGWDDVIDLDYSNKAMRLEMIKCMHFWVKEFNLDGFRCDMAMLTPVDFWMEARASLDKEKKLFWLAELDPLDNPEYMQVFDSGYSWRWMNACKSFMDEGAQNIHHLKYVLGMYRDGLPSNLAPALFTSNHDENSWNGTEYEKFREMSIPLAVFCATWRGFMLLYSGQEQPNQKRLAFFDKDPIHWEGTPKLHGFYHKLISLKKEHKAFHVTKHEDDCRFLGNSVDHHVVSFIRQNGNSKAIVLINFSTWPLHNVRVDTFGLEGIYTETFTGLVQDMAADDQYFHLQPWGYQIWVQ